MPKSLVEMASEIVTAQASHAPMTSDDISAGVRKIFAVLQNLQGLETARSGHVSPEVADNMPPQDSIQRNCVICLECQREFTLLSNRHLALHSMTSREYKLKHGLPLRQALSAKALTLARRKIAKQKGLGAKLAAHHRKQQ